MLRAAGKLTARVVVEPIGPDCSPGAVMDLLAEETDPVLLESSALHGDYGRYTVAACCPLEVIALRDGKLQDSSSNTLAEGDDAIWSALADAFGKVKLEGHPPEAGYVPGWMGYFGYEVGRHIERLPSRAVRDTHLPDMRMAFYDAVLLYDTLEQSWWLVRLEFDSSLRDAGHAAKTLQNIIARATDAPPEKPPALTHVADAKARPTASDAKSNFDPDDYRQAVAKCVDYIAAGDIFQVNLSQRFCVSDAPPAKDIYKTLRRRNPSWYAAYMSFESDGRPCAVASSSPELFVRVRGSHVITRPIKGTRPRVGDPQTDTDAKADLLASAKDNAELAMIIDLLRNDIGRVCKFGTVRVTDPCRLETHPTVFHLVGTVEGELEAHVGPAELLRATFPGGSITGAPKIRAMEIIDELEPSARAVYTGCIGHIGVDGSCEWNIVIRTVICDGSNAYVQVGGGIVADSSPDGEYHETLDKARAILEAIQEAREAVAQQARDAEPIKK